VVTFGATSISPNIDAPSPNLPESVGGFNAAAGVPQRSVSRFYEGETTIGGALVPCYLIDASI